MTIDGQGLSATCGSQTITAKFALLATHLSQGDLQHSKFTSGGILCICSHWFWMWNNQKAVSRSSAEAGLRMEGFPASVAWDCALAVLAPHFSAKATDCNIPFPQPISKFILSEPHRTFGNHFVERFFGL